MNARTTTLALAALAGTLLLGASARADSNDSANYWANRTGTTLNVGQSMYIVPAIAQPAPQEQPEGPAIEAAYRQGPEVAAPQQAPTPAFQTGYYYNFGNGAVLLPK